MMTSGQWRRAMVAGIAFVVLLVVGVNLALANSPTIKKKDTQQTAAAKYVDWLSDTNHRVAIIIGAYLIVLAALAFIWFGQALRKSLVADSFSAQAVSGIVTFAAAALAIGAVLYATPAGAHSLGDEPLPAGDTIRAVMDLFIPCLLLIFGLASALLIAIMAVGIQRTRTLPAWVGYIGWLGVIGGIFAIIFIPIVLPMLWFLIFAIVGLVRPPTSVVARSHEPSTEMP